MNPFTNLNSMNPVPTSSEERSLAPDLGRGFMLLLIVIAHAPVYLFAADNFMMTRPLGESAADNIVNFVCLLFVDNRAYPMFAALFGYSLAIMTKRQLDRGLSEGQVKRLLRRRSLLLIAFGFVHLVVIGGADILAAYGVSGLLLGWLLFKQERTQFRVMATIGIIYFILLPLVWILIFPFLTESDINFGLTAEHTYLQLVTEHAIAFPIVIMFNILLYPMMFLIAAGVWSARKRWLDHPQRYRKQLRTIAVGGIGISLIGAVPYALVGANAWSPESSLIGLFFILHIMTGVAGGVGYTALIALLSQSVKRALSKPTALLASVGKRSLTFYIYQEAMLVLWLSPVSLKLGGKLTSAGAFVVAVFIWLSGVAIAAWLERHGWRGPADALLRQLVYRQRRQQ